MTCLGCYSWKDEMRSRNGYQHRFVEEIHSGYSWATGASDSQIRCTLTMLFFLTVFKGVLFTLPARILDTCFFSWYSLSYEAENLFYQRTFQWIQSKDHDPSLTQPSRTWIILSTFTGGTIKRIVKLATLPLCWIGLMFASFWGTLYPLDGRMFFGNIENLWAIPIHTAPFGSTLYTQAYAPSYIWACNYTALCMQPVSNGIENKMYIFDADPSNFERHKVNSLLWELKQYNPNHPLIEQTPKPTSIEVTNAIQECRKSVDDYLTDLTQK